MKRCDKGHYYDPGKYSACPYCGVAVDLGPTRALTPDEVPADAATVGELHGTSGIEPVVGWLVCTQGPGRGKDYRLQSGYNFIGRASHMHVSLREDHQVSREKHAIVSYDPRHNRFTVLPGTAAQLVYLNGETLYQPTNLAPQDTLELGATTLCFIPFCTPAFQWP